MSHLARGGGEGGLFKAAIYEVANDGSGVRISITKLLGRDQIDVRTEHLDKGGKLKEITHAFVSAQPQEVAVK